MADSSEEAQKVLAEMQRRVEEFQSGGAYPSGDSHNRLSAKSLKLAFVILGLIVAAIASAFFIRNSDRPQKVKLTPEEQKQLLEMVPGYRTSVKGL